ncbi:uncharacterized protein LOC111395178 [Olea europaea var. sylvestris]|uniref:uncharacterized protein LOC111395178 n=1 Tax=Olea europaea var. sylvestris TaxID=158386 RepID=UPI000C1D0C19|nr:uncharacterized protein LOC111395178 [Olea europaea var. sylvestris]
MTTETISTDSSPASPPTISNPFFNFIDVTNPYRLDHGDNPSISLVPELLTVDNFTTWSRVVCRALRAKNNLGFISGAVTKPTSPDDPLFEAWERCNDLLTSWVQNSISPSIKSSIALMDDAAVLWDELKERFTQQNGPRIFQLKKALAGLQQEQDSVSVYYGKLKSIWDELNVFDPLPDCTCEKLTALTNRYQRDCVIQFLMCLNDSYANSRDQILLLDPLPSIGKVLSMIQQQEMQHLMLSNLQSPDMMALASRKSYSIPKPNIKPSQPFKRDRP